MHGYYYDRTRLKKKLEKFNLGQFLMETKVGDKQGLVFRGEIRFCSIPDMDEKIVMVYFNWLCEQRFGVDQFFTPIPRWVLLEPPVGFQNLIVNFSSYYFQRKKEGREERIKMWSSHGEVCRFFKRGDPSNLEKKGDEFLPGYQPESNPDSKEK